jgi:hypothetical protein
MIEEDPPQMNWTLVLSLPPASRALRNCRVWLRLLLREDSRNGLLRISRRCRKKDTDKKLSELADQINVEAANEEEVTLSYKEDASPKSKRHGPSRSQEEKFKERMNR